MLTLRQANAVYDILVREAGASNREFHRANFITAVARDDFTEYSFCGSLGFGGKFVIGHGMWYVTADPADLALSGVAASVLHTNEALTRLKTIFSFVRREEVAA